MSIDDCRIIKLPKFFDSRGNLSFLENNAQIPFEIKRTYWVYDVPGGEYRWGHAYRKTEEFIVALSGSFSVTVDDGTSKKTFMLNRSNYGLYVPQGIWRELENFSTNSFALEFASTQYDSSDYIRNYSLYQKMKEDGEV